MQAPSDSALKAEYEFGVKKIQKELMQLNDLSAIIDKQPADGSATILVFEIDADKFNQ
jgi:hypothetical protein